MPKDIAIKVRCHNMMSVYTIQSKINIFKSYKSVVKVKSIYYVLFDSIYIDDDVAFTPSCSFDWLTMFINRISIN